MYVCMCVYIHFFLSFPFGKIKGMFSELPKQTASSLLPPASPSACLNWCQ